MTELILRTGFQSSRRIFKQTLPSRSILGWYTYKSDTEKDRQFPPQKRHVGAAADFCSPRELKQRGLLFLTKKMKHPLTFVLHFTLGASWGYICEIKKLKINVPPLSIRHTRNIRIVSAPEISVSLTFKILITDWVTYHSWRPKPQWSMLLGSRKQKHEHKKLRNSLIVAFIWSYGDLKAEKIIFAIWKANSNSPGQIQLTYICNIQLHLLNPGHNTAKLA